MKLDIVAGKHFVPTGSLDLRTFQRGRFSSILCSAAILVAGCSTQEQSRYGDRKVSSHHVQRGQYRLGSSQQQQQRQKCRIIPDDVLEPTTVAKVNCNEPTPGLIRMTKAMPPEATLGGDFKVEVNLVAQACAANVIVRDTVPANASYVRSEPVATVEGDQLIWKLGNLDAGETRKIQLWLKAEKEGGLVNCASVSADPRTCANTRIVHPDIQLTKNEPKDVILCDPIPVTLVVKNVGSSQLTGVKVTDSLPDGLTSEGKSSLLFEAGALAPGESKEFKFNATASRTGKYINSAEVISDQGVSAKASASTAVHQAVLGVVCKAPEQQYLGRPFNVCFTLSNSSDTAASGTQVSLPMPTGLTVVSTTGGGHPSGNGILWDLGTVPANASREVCVTFAATNSGNYAFQATAKGECVTPVATTCGTRVVGVSALLLEKADNPDPIQIGEKTTYTVKITNQGTADDTNVKVVVQFPVELDPISASADGVIDGKTVTFPAYPRLAPKQAFEYNITARGVKTGDARVKFIRTSDGIPASTTAEESTRVY